MTTDYMPNLQEMKKRRETNIKQKAIEFRLEVVKMIQENIDGESLTISIHGIEKEVVEKIKNELEEKGYTVYEHKNGECLVIQGW